MTKHPDSMPDDIARRLADLAREHGYGIEQITLTWLTRDLGQPAIGRVTYAPDKPEPVPHEHTVTVDVVPGRLDEAVRRLIHQEVVAASRSDDGPTRRR